MTETLELGHNETVRAEHFLDMLRDYQTSELSYPGYCALSPDVLRDLLMDDAFRDLFQPNAGAGAFLGSVLTIHVYVVPSFEPQTIAFKEAEDRIC